MPQTADEDSSDYSANHNHQAFWHWHSCPKQVYIHRRTLASSSVVFPKLFPWLSPAVVNAQWDGKPTFDWSYSSPSRSMVDSGFCTRTTKSRCGKFWPTSARIRLSTSSPLYPQTSASTTSACMANGSLGTPCLPLSPAFKRCSRRIRRRSGIDALCCHLKRERRGRRRKQRSWSSNGWWML